MCSGGCRHERSTQPLPPWLAGDGPQPFVRPKGNDGCFSRGLAERYQLACFGLRRHILEDGHSSRRSGDSGAAGVSRAAACLGRDFLHAPVLGLEVECRIGKAVYPEGYVLLERIAGHNILHQSSRGSCGCFDGAVDAKRLAVAGKVLSDCLFRAHRVVLPNRQSASPAADPVEVRKTTSYFQNCSELIAAGFARTPAVRRRRRRVQDFTCNGVHAATRADDRRGNAAGRLPCNPPVYVASCPAKLEMFGDAVVTPGSLNGNKCDLGNGPERTCDRVGPGRHKSAQGHLGSMRGQGDHLRSPVGGVAA